MTTAEATSVEVRCAGTLHGGQPCNKLLVRVADFTGHIEAKCPKCNAMMHYTHPRVITMSAQCNTSETAPSS